MTNIIKEIEIILNDPDQNNLSGDKLKPLTDLILSDSKYDIFFDHCHKLGASSGICFNQVNEFPNQVVRRAKEVGSKQTIKEIDNYLNERQVAIECGLLLYSIYLDTEFTFSNGVRLIRIQSLKDSTLIDFLSKEHISTGGISTALLVIDYTTPKEVSSSIFSESRKSDWTKINTKTDLIKILDDTRLILSLGRHPSYGIPVVGSFEIIPDNLKFLNNGVGYGIYSESRTAFGPELLELEMNRADELLKKFNSLPCEDQDKIRVAAKRLNDAKIDSNWANKSINLRICLENLFCTPDSLGIRQAISERAPTYTSFSKTRAGNIYKFLSRAVHTGIPAEHEEINENMIIPEIHKTIIQYIQNGGYPEWPPKKRMNRLQKLWSSIKSS